MKLFQKQNQDLDTLRDITDDVLESDFVPYAAHIDPFTIITKNGELLQTLKITGFSYEIDNAVSDIRSAIREAVLSSIDSTSYALWFHTIRRKTNLDTGGEYPDDASRAIHNLWKDQNDLTRQFTNEVYVTIVREGQSADVMNPMNFMRSIIPPQEKYYRESYIDHSQSELNLVVESMLDALAQYGAQRLGIVEREDGFYSEFLEFLNKIINLTDEQIPVPDVDISHYLTTHEITFGYNAVEVRSQEGKRRFGSILTLKEHQDLPLMELDRFLQLPIEFIVAQCIDFINRDIALEGYRFQKRLVEISGDYKLAEISGLNDILGSNKGRPTDYGEQQISVFLLADTTRLLEEYVEKAVSTLGSMGIISIREDIRFEECYWSQLPANFEFLKRLRSINTARIGGFASLHNFPAGKKTGNHWGSAVTVLHTVLHTPYFFSFHVGDNGHSTIIGSDTAGKTLLANFLVAESGKFQPRVIYFDCRGKAQGLINAMGGHSMQIGGDAATAINPLQLPDSEKNRMFLADWLHALVGNRGELAQCEEAIAYLFTLPPEKHTFTYLGAYVNENIPDLAAAFAPWHGSGEHAAMYQHATDAVRFENRVTAFDLGALMDKPALLNATFSYLLQRVTLTLNGAPAIIVLDEAWKLLGTDLIAPRAPSWLDMLRKRNAMALLLCDSLDEASRHPITPTIAGKIATRLFLPDTGIGMVAQRAFSLSDAEVSFLGQREPDTMHCLIKRGENSVQIQLNESALKAAAPLLSTTPSIRDAIRSGQDGWWRPLMGS